MKKRTLLIQLSVLLHSSCAYAQLNTYIVNTTADPTVDSSGNIPGGGISLRSAILQANATGAPKGIVGSSYNLIAFDPNVFSTPVLLPYKWSRNNLVAKLFRMRKI